jgi:hypothetical protein
MEHGARSRDQKVQCTFRRTNLCSVAMDCAVECREETSNTNKDCTTL